MNVLVRALLAERLKLRHTLALWMCAIAPAVVVGLYVLQISVRDWSGRTPPPAEAWEMFARSVLGLWAFLMVPLYVTLQSALLAGLEHGNQQWKHLLALPVPRGVHYLAKWLVLNAMVFASTALLVLLVPPAGWLVSKLQPAFGLAGPPPLAMLVRAGMLIGVCALLLIAIHTWVAIRWRSFTVAVGTGMVATVAGFLIGQSEDYGYLYAWSMPTQAIVSRSVHLHETILLSTLGAVLVTAAGLWDFLRRGDR